MTQKWINFKVLREQLDFQAVLRHYNVTLKPKKADQLVGFCPLPNQRSAEESLVLGEPAAEVFQLLRL